MERVRRIRHWDAEARQPHAVECASGVEWHGVARGGGAGDHRPRSADVIGCLQCSVAPAQQEFVTEITDRRSEHSHKRRRYSALAVGEQNWQCHPAPPYFSK